MGEGGNGEGRGDVSGINEAIVSTCAREGRGKKSLQTNGQKNAKKRRMVNRTNLAGKEAKALLIGKEGRGKRGGSGRPRILPRLEDQFGGVVSIEVHRLKRRPKNKRKFRVEH